METWQVALAALLAILLLGYSVLLGWITASGLAWKLDGIPRAVMSGRRFPGGAATVLLLGLALLATAMLTFRVGATEPFDKLPGASPDSPIIREYALGVLGFAGLGLAVGLLAGLMRRIFYRMDHPRDAVDLPELPDDPLAPRPPG